MFSLQEAFDAIVMIVVVGYIFLDDSLPAGRGKQFLLSIMATAPAIVLHEAAHKIVGLFFGLEAVFHAAYQWLVFGLLLKWLNLGVFFVPGYVQLRGIADPLALGLSAFAGPMMNGLLYISARLLLRKRYSPQTTYVLIMTRKINGFLFVLNSIPLPGFDGFSVFSNFLALAKTYI